MPQAEEMVKQLIIAAAGDGRGTDPCRVENFFPYKCFLAHPLRTEVHATHLVDLSSTLHNTPLHPAHPYPAPRPPHLPHTQHPAPGTLPPTYTQHLSHTLPHPTPLHPCTYAPPTPLLR